MNIPSSLADDMFSIAPSDIKVLKPNEISIYRLGGPDMVYSEKRELAMAKQLGLSRLEYMERERQASKLEKECSENFPETDEWLECYQKARRDLGLTLWLSALSAVGIRLLAIDFDALTSPESVSNDKRL